MGLYDQLEGMEEILDDFIVEVNELLDQLNEDLLILEDGDDHDGDLVNRVFHAYHTIKGTSGFLSFDQCTELAHAAKDILNTIRNGKLDLTSQVVDVLLETVDWFSNFISNVQNRTENQRDIADLLDMINGIFKNNGQKNKGNGQVNSTGTQSKEETLLNIPKESVSEFYTESTELLDALNNNLLSLKKAQNNFVIAENEELVNNIFRAFHTLKGNSGLLQLEQMSGVAHKSEDILNVIREGKLSPTSEIIDVLLSAVDWIKNFINELQENNSTTADTSDIDDQLIKIMKAYGMQEERKEDLPKKQKRAETTTKPMAKKIDQTICVTDNWYLNVINTILTINCSNNQTPIRKRNIA